MSSLTSTAFVLMTACLAACGQQVVEFELGDDGGARVDAGDDPDAPPADLPPRVTMTVPSDLATGVALDSTVEATFSKPMDGATITDGTFIVFQGSVAIAGNVTFDAATNTATFDPDLDLAPSLIYTATVTTGVRDTTGRALVDNYGWSFTTAANAQGPTVTSTTPIANATAVSVNKRPTATFSKAMRPSSLTPLTFTLRQGATMIGGTVALDGVTNTATFTPTSPLALGQTFTATVTTGAQDTGGTALAADHTWTFETSACGQAAVDLGAAASYAVLAGSTVTSTGATNVTGDLGVSPGTAVTGFPPGILTGATHAGDVPAATALANLTTAYNDAAGRTLCAITVAGNLGGQTLTPGLYKSTSSLAISSGDLTLDAMGDADAVFIFQMATTLTTTAGRQVILTNGAKAANVFWQVGTSATLGTTSAFKGTIMADQSITLNTGATLTGRALARIAAVNLSANTIVRPAP